MSDKITKSDTPLQDFANENGLNKFFDVMREIIKSNNDIRNNPNLTEDEIKFLDGIATQLNEFFMGKNGKNYWYFNVNFVFSCFSGYRCEIPNDIKGKFACVVPPGNDLVIK